MFARFGNKFKRLLKDDIKKYCMVSSEIYHLKPIDGLREDEIVWFYLKKVEEILKKYYPEVMKEYEVILKDLSNDRNKKQIYLISLTKKRVA